MAFDINSFQNALPKGGARPSLFRVSIPVPGDVGGVNMTRKMGFTTQAATIPAGTIDPIEVNYFGRIFKLPGGRTFEDWTTTVLNDEDYSVRSAIEKWQDNINGNITNKERFGSVGTGGSVNGIWTVDADVIQYSPQGHATRKYTMHNAWPTMITEITLDWAEATAIETFDITWAYSHWSSTAIRGHDASLNVNIQGKVGTVTAEVGAAVGVGE